MRRALVPILAAVVAIGAGFAVASGQSASDALAGSSRGGGPGGPPAGMRGGAAPPNGARPGQAGPGGPPPAR